MTNIGILNCRSKLITLAHLSPESNLHRISWIFHDVHQVVALERGTVVHARAVAIFTPPPTGFDTQPGGSAVTIEPTGGAPAGAWAGGGGGAVVVVDSAAAGVLTTAAVVPTATARRVVRRATSA